MSLHAAAFGMSGRPEPELRPLLPHVSRTPRLGRRRPCPSSATEIKSCPRPGPDDDTMEYFVEYLDEVQEVLDVIHVMEVARVGRNHRRRRIFRQRIDPLEVFTDDEFTAVRVALRYLATDDLQLTVGDTADMSQASVCRSTKRVTCAITTIAPLYIWFPTPAEETTAMQDFSIIANMPGCIDCIDGTLIPIIGPGGNDSELYRCRKDYFAYNVMAVNSASLAITSLVVNWAGSAHDSRIFNESNLCQTLQEGHYRGFLLQSGYPCRSYLFTPITNPRTEKR
ncbi:uncharacterized protein LOC121855887 [Homarus americanus]|uniref:uncharacterized protein LOC121855887 n=1 Tax=Homarus americanus TaxID=6706 RepID=UPI001C494EDD|nr:uncharacterized protein LOC121855887 [Homarus americanus]